MYQIPFEGEEGGHFAAITYKKLFSVDKAPIPEDGLQTIELLDYLLFIRKQENTSGDPDEVLTDLDETIAQTCSS